MIYNNENLDEWEAQQGEWHRYPELLSYKWKGDEIINFGLRKNFITPIIQNLVDRITNLILEDGPELSEETLFYRGVRGELSKFLNELPTGEEIILKGFSSMTDTKSIAGNFGTVFRFQFPAGSPLILMPTGSFEFIESEILSRPDLVVRKISDKTFEVLNANENFEVPSANQPNFDSDFSHWLIEKIERNPLWNIDYILNWPSYYLVALKDPDHFFREMSKSQTGSFERSENIQSPEDLVDLLMAAYSRKFPELEPSIDSYLLRAFGTTEMAELPDDLYDKQKYPNFIPSGYFNAIRDQIPKEYWRYL